jgi:gamma-glutamyl-gamma-aminobutyrate hydrolase PuuD
MFIGLTQRVEWLPDRGERRDCLDQAWTTFFCSHGFVPIPIPNRIDVVDTLFDQIGIGGVILTGGNDLDVLDEPRNPAPERDALERKLIDECSQRNLPVLGVCRGMQMLVTYHGGKLSPVEGHAGTRHPLSGNNGCHLKLDDRVEINSFHDYGIHREDMGEEFTAAALAPDDTVEAVAHRRLKQWGIMWHIERGNPDSRDAQLLNQLFRKA